ncbi:hypothetical protein AB0L05_03995 [Nonomuraea pusilla]|uniref:EamA family transporter n=1 Tax=Nonomuraea pusilla TaxID=46177 RepID=UPI0033266A3C
MARARWWPEFVTLSAIWGASFAFIKIGVDAGVPPAWVALWRCLLGAATLWLIVAARRERVPREPRRLAGLALGFAGVLTVLGAWGGLGGGGLVGSLACLAATACYGAGFAYTRRHLSRLPHSSTSLAALQITCAAAELALFAPLTSGGPRWPGAQAALALLALGALRPRRRKPHEARPPALTGDAARLARVSSGGGAGGPGRCPAGPGRRSGPPAWGNRSAAVA